MLKKGKRLSKAEMKKELRRYKKIAPIYKKTGLTTFEEYVCNTPIALVATVKELKMNFEHIEMLIFLHQFEFFEKRWIHENYTSMFIRQEYTGDRRAKNISSWLINNGYLEFYAHDAIEYTEFTKETNSYSSEQIISDVKYKLSVEGLNVVKTFFKHLTGDTPSMKDKTKRRTIWKDVSPWQAIDYTTF